MTRGYGLVALFSLSCLWDGFYGDPVAVAKSREIPLSIYQSTLIIVSPAHVAWVLVPI